MLTERLNRQELLLIDKLECANDVLRKNGVGGDIDSSEWRSEVMAIRNFNKDKNTKYTVNDLRESRFAMVEWCRKLGSQDPLQEAISYWNNPVWLAKLDACEGAAIASMYYADEKIDFHRITTRPADEKEFGDGKIAQATFECYRVQMPWVRPELIHIQPSSMTINRTFKSDTIREWDLEYFMDDAPEDLELAVVNSNVTGLLLPCVWNESYKSKNPRILTFENALKNGLSGLGLSSDELQRLPRNVQAYMIIADHAYINHYVAQY